MLGSDDLVEMATDLEATVYYSEDAAGLAANQVKEVWGGK